MAVYSLTQLNLHIKDTLDDTYPDPFWITAEIHNFTFNNLSGHCYLELSDGLSQPARAKAMIWKRTYEVLDQKFRIATGRPMEKGLKVQVLAKVEFSVQFGLSLIIWDIDPSYSVGAIAAKRAETLERIQAEGWLDRNKSLVQPPLCSRLAIVSSPNASGFQDFWKHLEENSYRFNYSIRLFPAVMQGEDAVHSIQQALAEIAKQAADFDAVVFIRGGGSTSDLQIFDHIEVARSIAFMPLPVLTGIGHDKDNSIADLVAWRAFKTPTAVAAYLLEYHLQRWLELNSIQAEISQKAYYQWQQQHLIYKNKFRQLEDVLRKRKEAILLTNTRTFFAFAQKIRTQLADKADRFAELELQWRSANPLFIMHQGYARIFQEGRRVLRLKDIKPETEFYLQIMDEKLVVSLKKSSE